MRKDDSRQPIFIRSRATNRYVYNYRSPVALLLLTGSLALIAVVIAVMNGGTSSDAAAADNGLRDAVRRAANSIEDEPHVDSDYSDYSELIEEAVADASEEQIPVYRVTAEPVGDTDDYEITTDQTDVVYCMSIKKSASDSGGFSVPGGSDGAESFVPEYDLKVSVAKGGC